uniref:TadE/TadG family type IV pilus assembly protein n=1 Tax=Vibrio sp. 624788 TaxID=1234362 RepID=UPI00037AABF5
ETFNSELRNHMKKIMGCNRQRGVASIEFSLSFMAFFLMCAFLVELSFISYTMAVSDYALSQAARDTKVIFQP